MFEMKTSKGIVTFFTIKGKYLAGVFTLENIIKLWIFTIIHCLARLLYPPSSSFPLSVFFLEPSDMMEEAYGVKNRVRQRTIHQ